MIVSKEIGLDYGHTLPNHFSFCNQIHGHRARVIAYVEGEVIAEQGNSSQGMVMDFKFVKQLLMSEVHDPLDHGFAVWKDDNSEMLINGSHYVPDLMNEGNFNKRDASCYITTLEFIKIRNTKVLITDEPPTAEYLAKWAFLQLAKKIAEQGCQLTTVEWYETPTSFARYTIDDYRKYLTQVGE